MTALRRFGNRLHRGPEEDRHLGAGMHGDDDQIVPIGAAGLMSARSEEPTLKVYPAIPQGMPRPTRTRSTRLARVRTAQSQRRRDMEAGD